MVDMMGCCVLYTATYIYALHRLVSSHKYIIQVMFVYNMHMRVARILEKESLLNVSDAQETAATTAAMAAWQR